MKCTVCGFEFEPLLKNHYVSRDNGETGLSVAFKNSEETLYDTFDCPQCGCQHIAQKRKRIFIPRDLSSLTDTAEDDNEEEDTKED